MISSHGQAGTRMGSGSPASHGQREELPFCSGLSRLVGLGAAKSLHVSGGLDAQQKLIEEHQEGIKGGYGDAGVRASHSTED